MPGVPGDLIPPGVPPQVPPGPDSDAPPAAHPEIVMSQVNVLCSLLALTILHQGSVGHVYRDGPRLLHGIMQWQLEFASVAILYTYNMPYDWDELAWT